MKYKITLTLSLITFSLFSQDKLLFDELYELQENKVKVYLDGGYKVIYKQCADYYMICKINNQLEFTDSVHIFDLKDKIVAKGIFQSSRLNGNYSSYFQNGRIESTGKYDNGVRIGVWEYYYDNGQIKKMIDFGKGAHYPILNSFYKKNGKQNVINGNGQFKDFLITSLATAEKIKYQGKVKNGLLDGIWKTEIHGTVTGTEIFDNGNFIEGTSFSVVLGNQKYSDNPTSTVYGVNYLERVKIWGPAGCNKGLTLGLSRPFYENLYEALVKKTEDFNNSWYFVEIQANDNSIFQKVIVFPENESLEAMINDRFYNKEIETIWSKPRVGREVIIIYFKDDVYFSKTKKIDNFILNFRW